MFFERHNRLNSGTLTSYAINGLLALAAVLLLLPGRQLVAFDGTRNVALATPRGAEYRLGAMDKLRVKVFAWRAARDEVFEWEALNGEYTIGAAGTISVPLIGEIAASGATTAELAIEIAESLKNRIGLVERPDAAVEVLQFRPFYVAGDVDKPGEFPYRPGMIVLQALTIAGGQLRPTDLGAMRLEREVIAKSGEIDSLAAERTAALARKARLDAELKGLPQVNFPDELVRPDSGMFAATAIAQERALFMSRQDAFDTQIKALQELRRYLKSEIASIERQIESHNQEVAIAREEYEGIKALVAKKLVVENRRLGLKRGLAQVEGNSLRLESNLMRVKQDLSRAEISILELSNTRGKEIAAELATIETQLEQTTRKLETAVRLLNESETVAPRLVADRRNGGRQQPVYTIIRQSNGMVTEITATETTAVMPGDTIKVETRPRSDAFLAEKKPAGGLSDEMPPLQLTDGVMRKSVDDERRRF